MLLFFMLVTLLDYVRLVMVSYASHFVLICCVRLGAVLSYANLVTLG